MKLSYELPAWLTLSATEVTAFIIRMDKGTFR
jgi:hypothetical protein